MRTCISENRHKNTSCLVTYQHFCFKLTWIFPKTIMISSANFYEFWMMGTYLINTMNMVSFLMTLGVLKKTVHQHQIQALSICVWLSDSLLSSPQWRIWSHNDVIVRSWVYTHRYITWNTSMQHHFQAAHLTHHDINRWGHTLSWLWVLCELAVIH